MEITVNTQWTNEIQLLKSLGFVVPDEYPPAFNVQFSDGDIVMIEEEVIRNRFCVVLLEYGDYDLYIQNDIACGFTHIPVRWSELDIEWLNHLKHGFEGKGFKRK